MRSARQGQADDTRPDRMAGSIPRRPGRALVWRNVEDPSADDLQRLGEEFGLDREAILDAVKTHHRPKLQRHGDTLLVVLRPARHFGSHDPVALGHLFVFVSASCVVTARSEGFTDLEPLRARLSGGERPEPQPEAVLYAILGQVVDEYGPVVLGLEDEIDDIEDQLFAGDTTVARRIYDLLREVIAFQRAVHPLVDMLSGLQRGAEKYDVDPTLRRVLRDVHDRSLRTTERADSLRVLLQNALTVQSTLVAQQQNDEMRKLSEANLAQNLEMQRLSEANVAQTEESKKISSWAAILFAPTLIGTIYGMNFDVMPELHWTFGYPLAVGAMLFMGVGLYVAFKRKHWL